jgi:transcriptional regulator with XRE-family HTH domain
MMPFSEKEFKDRLTTIINSHFKNEQELVELSKKLNVTRATINRWRNQSLTPKIEKLAKLTILTKTSLDYIVFGKKENLNTDATVFNEVTFKNRLSSIIDNNFKSNLQLAKMLKISDSTARAWKKKLATPSICLLAELANITNLSLDYIVLK